MNNYDRLTVRHPHSDYIAITETKQLKETRESKMVLNRLADLEDKIEDGTLIELPCKVGDTIYVPYQYNGVEGISFHKIYQIVIMENDIYVDFEVDTDIDYVFAYIYNFGKFNITWLNKRFFLTKAEAEAKLKGELV